MLRERNRGRWVVWRGADISIMVEGHPGEKMAVMTEAGREAAEQGQAITICPEAGRAGHTVRRCCRGSRRTENGGQTWQLEVTGDLSL